ncbi:MAG: hypothetical protein WCT24_01195 [Patescibacteria group bacterium]
MELGGMNKLYILLIVLAIGLLGLLSVYSVMSARTTMRDAVRLSDVRQVQAGLEIYFHANSAYPIASDRMALGTSGSSCLHDAGFSGTCSVGTEPVYIERVSLPPTAGLNSKSSCGSESNAYCYGSPGSAYSIQFELERSQPLLNLVKGLNCATASGFEAGACAE